ncbi:unc-93 (predicted), partial [Pycnogonum litorale]
MAELRSVKPSIEDGSTNLAYVEDSGNGEAKVENRICQAKALEMSEKEKRRAKIKIIKNLLVVSFGFLLLFTAFQSISNLQSSINSIEGLGTASLSVIYAALIISCMFVPPYMIARLGCKYTLVVSMLMYSSYFAANFHAQWYTLMPTSVILGLGGAPLWSSKCTYLTEIAKQYAELTGESTESMVVKFFGVFFMIFQSGQIWGNLISAYVLRPDRDVQDVENDPDILDLCGVNFCNEQSAGNKTNTNLDRPSDPKVYTLCAIYLACALLAALFIFVVLDQLKRSGQEEEEGVRSGNAKPSLKLLVATFKHLRKPQQILIIPLTMYSGVEQAFIASDFTR